MGGFLTKLLAVIQRRQQIKNMELISKEFMLKREKYLKMNANELSCLSDDDLRTALSERLMLEQDKLNWDTAETLSSFKGAKKIYYIVSCFDMEVLNGGLCQFFVNYSRILAPYVSQCLNTIGASEYERLFSDFVSTNRIDLNDLDSFIIEDADEYAAQTERYPFDNFDDKYCQLYEEAPLENILLAYARENLVDFETI